VHRFVRGLRLDYDAVRNGLTLIIVLNTYLVMAAM